MYSLVQNGPMRPCVGGVAAFPHCIAVRAGRVLATNKPQMPGNTVRRSFSTACQHSHFPRFRERTVPTAGEAGPRTAGAPKPVRNTSENPHARATAQAPRKTPEQESCVFIDAPDMARRHAPPASDAEDFRRCVRNTPRCIDFFLTASWHVRNRHKCICICGDYAHLHATLPAALYI